MLYTVRILRGADDQFVENFKTACREKRFASPTHFLFVAFCFFLSPLSPILLPRPVVCSFIVRTYTPAAIGSADEMNTLALREADAESKVQSQRVSKTNKKTQVLYISGSRMPYCSIAGLQWSMASSLLGDSPPCLFWGCLVGWLIRRLLVDG